MSKFALQFDAAQIEELAARYSYRKDDSDALAAGARARSRGRYTRDDLLIVYRWKTDRSVGLFTASESETATTTGSAFGSSDEGVRMDLLTSLPGVGVPVGSALLYAAFPGDYPILDVRALESLGGRGQPTYRTDYWVDYVKACRSIAAKSGVSLRTLDKALWQYSKEQ